MPDSTRSHLVRLGAFTILGVLLFAAMVFMFKPAVTAFRGGYRVILHLDYAGEIRRGTPVRYLGITAGEVVAVNYSPPQVGGVDVTVLLRRDAGVRNDPEAPPYVDTKVTGEAYIEFPQADPAAPMLQEGDRIRAVYRKTVPDLIADLATLSKTFDATAREFKSAAVEIRDEIDSVGASLRKVSDHAADLLEYRDINDSGAAARPNISTAVQRLDRALAGAERLLGDGALQRDVKATVASLRRTGERLARAAEDVQAAAHRVRAVADRGDTLAGKLEDRLDQLGSTIDRQNKNLDRLAVSLLEATERLSGLLASARRLVEEVDQGKGTLGRLVSDPGLFEDLVAAVAQARRALLAAQIVFTELREHPGDYLSVGRRGTSDEERRKRIDELRRKGLKANP